MDNEPRPNDSRLPDSAGRKVADYRSVCRLAVVSVAFGLLSILTVFHWSLFTIPLIGVVLAWTALVRISELPDELIGRGLAWTGLGLSLALGTLGGGGLAVALMVEVPHGYRAISIDDLQPEEGNKAEPIPELALDLDEKKQKVFIKGFIYPGPQNYGIKRFILVPTLGHCNFCRKDLKSTEIILVTLSGDLTTEYRADRISLGGKFQVNPNQARLPSGGVPYRIMGDYLK
ncbi:MAG: DUF4190 domain-containing protein [Candidatus Nealsonbacteria bacterium]|nr:DUF4190 domain-containing protein [Candidatus Nealsonbacteria bacterium]